ncbi:MAG: hypothetical protein LC790_17230, partial [Actinobacteria bacterium]|nr:hypothetical protein [Actinomycetota bacterium]
GTGPLGHAPAGSFNFDTPDKGAILLDVIPRRVRGRKDGETVVDLATTKDELASRGLRSGETQSANKGVELCALDDPDGNVVTLIGNFRVHY